MRSTGRELVTYARLCGAQINAQLRYRSDFVVGGIGKLIESSTRFLGLLLLLHAIRDLDGWTPAEIAMMQGFLMIGAGVTMFLSAFWELSGDLRWGDFTQHMIRPMSPLLSFTAHRFEIAAVFGPLTGAALLAVAWRWAGVPWTAWNAVILLIGVAGTALVTAGFHLIAGSTAFWTWSMAGMRIEGSIRTIAPFPLSVFPPGLEFVLTYVIPVGFVAFVPVDALVTDGAGITGPLIGVGVGVVLCVIGAAVFSIGTRRYVATAS